ncbi:uncharacterized protein LOC125584378 [Brassica napus]|uniref:uncharacterized protein LOC125584378 n=1 Tax=Brassica napus TaxID=3708 RepID=UPI0020795673|nr:uncharacterized protein LOC125584378 [Brassica napus]
MCSREWRDLEVNKNSVWFRILYLMESSTSINGNLFYRERTETVKARVWHKVISFYSSRYPSNLDKSFVMGQLVKLVVGVWEQVGIRGWLFLEDPTERRYDVMVHENQTYASLMDLVRTRYSVGTDTAVCLTFEFPEWMRIPADVAWPPVDVRGDGDVDLFMSMRLEIQDLKLMVTIGNNVVACYLFQRRDNYTIIGSSSGNLAVNVNLFRGISDVSRLPLRGANDNPGGLTDGAAYWENILGQGEVTTGQQFLLGVCTDDDDTTELRNPRLTQGKSPFADALETSEGTESSTDSSAAPLNAFPQIAGSGVIRLKEGIHQPVANPSLALIIGML